MCHRGGGETDVKPAGGLSASGSPCEQHDEPENSEPFHHLIAGDRRWEGVWRLSGTVGRGRVVADGVNLGCAGGRGEQGEIKRERGGDWFEGL